MKGQKSHNATNCNYNRIINKYIIINCQKKLKLLSSTNLMPINPQESQDLDFEGIDKLQKKKEKSSQ
jgi:hypothetical protein